MKSFIIALIFVSCVVSFSHADDGWATGYGKFGFKLQKLWYFFQWFNWKLIRFISVPIYKELVAELDVVKANVQGESAKQAIQKVHDDVKDLLSWLQQRDGEQVPITVSRLKNDLTASESQLNADRGLQAIVHDVAAKIDQLRNNPNLNLAQYSEALNKIMKDFNDALKRHFGGGC